MQEDDGDRAVSATPSCKAPDAEQHTAQSAEKPMAVKCLPRRFLLPTQAWTLRIGTAGTGVSMTGSSRATPGVDLTSTSSFCSSSVESSVGNAVKNAGPAYQWYAAAAGPGPPRPSLPDLQFGFSPAAAAGAAGAAGFLGGPSAGQLGFPCSAFMRAYTFVASISGVPFCKWGPFQWAMPLLKASQSDVPSFLIQR